MDRRPVRVASCDLHQQRRRIRPGLLIVHSWSRSASDFLSRTYHYCYRVELADVRRSYGSTVTRSARSRDDASWPTVGGLRKLRHRGGTCRLGRDLHEPLRSPGQRTCRCGLLGFRPCQEHTLAHWRRLIVHGRGRYSLVSTNNALIRRGLLVSGNEKSSGFVPDASSTKLITEWIPLSC